MIKHFRSYRQNYETNVYSICSMCFTTFCILFSGASESLVLFIIGICYEVKQKWKKCSSYEQNGKRKKKERVRNKFVLETNKKKRQYWKRNTCSTLRGNLDCSLQEDLMEWRHLGGFMKVQSINSAFTGSLIRLGEAGKTIRLRSIDVYIIIYQIIVYSLLV